MYVSPCAAHYFRQQFEEMDEPALIEQQRLLSDGLIAIEEERAEIAAMPGRGGAKLRGDLEREAAFLRSKLAAVEELIAERVGGEPAVEDMG